jgi:ribosomal protein S18 acetylase RimI-like enzyme
MVPAGDGPTHRYIGAAPGLTVDAYAVQHPGVPGPQAIRSVAGHLIALHFVLERDVAPDRATRALRWAATKRDAFRWLDPPPSPGPLTAKAASSASCFIADRMAGVRHRSYMLVCTPDDFVVRPAAKRARLVTARARLRDAAACGRLWRAVGEGFWTERFRWSDARWRARLREPGVSFWIATVGGAEVGGYELARKATGCKIEGFGIVPARRGTGLGRALLADATRRGFAAGASKVWLHTATDDHPAALPNYRASGYRVVRERPLRNPMP